MRVGTWAAALLLTACATATPAGIEAPEAPIPALTPGVVLTGSMVEVCTPGWATAHRRSLSAAQRAAVLVAYRLPAGTVPAEWDHLIPLELGGGNGPGNIWPQLSATDRRIKDTSENRLHARVCTGQVLLGAAQEEMRSWGRKGLVIYPSPV